MRVAALSLTLLASSLVSCALVGCAVTAVPDSELAGTGHRTPKASGTSGDPATTDNGEEETATDEKDPQAPPATPSSADAGFTDPGIPPASGGGDAGATGHDDAGGPADPVGKYAFVDPTHLIAQNLVDHAVAYYDANKSHITNTAVMTIVDFSLHSGKQRFFIIDMTTGAVSPYVVAHGKMSDPDWTGYATTFSNVSGSNESSLGFALTGEVYSGEHGRSLRLEGLSTTNSNLLDRDIVIHGATYVNEGADKQGRSLGCFALDQSEKDAIIDKLLGGSLLYADLGVQ